MIELWSLSSDSAPSAVLISNCISFFFLIFPAGSFGGCVENYEFVKFGCHELRLIK